jgi:AraC family transcriptional regulator, regulatory protein of adaptative response / methylated-DNA-[protein]-cysteine methyltransferase
MRPRESRPHRASSEKVYGDDMASLQKGDPSLDAGQAGEEIRHLLGDSSLGRILVASSGKGLVSILMGEDEELLIEDLQRRFPEVQLVRGDGEEDRHRLKLVLAFAEDPSRGIDLPLDVRGTDFQRRVWQALREIPVGQTSSFTDIAQKIGEPKAMRAVGNACSTNNLALAVPCHRVLHRDGTLSGAITGATPGSASCSTGRRRQHGVAADSSDTPA